VTPSVDGVNEPVRCHRSGGGGKGTAAVAFRLRSVAGRRSAEATLLRSGIFHCINPFIRVMVLPSPPTDGVFLARLIDSRPGKILKLLDLERLLNVGPAGAERLPDGEDWRSRHRRGRHQPMRLVRRRCPVENLPSLWYQPGYMPDTLSTSTLRLVNAGMESSATRQLHVDGATRASSHPPLLGWVGEYGEWGSCGY
jgi:hypothetical protein